MIEITVGLKHNLVKICKSPLYILAQKNCIIFFFKFTNLVNSPKHLNSTV